MSATLTPAHTGKIARLPVAVREELNTRLLAGESGRNLIDWLNGLPEVQTVLDAQFDGKPVTEPNFSRWRKGGYRQWLAEREARALAAQELAGALRGMAAGEHVEFSESLACWLAAQFCATMGPINALPQAERLKAMDAVMKPVLALRRGNHRMIEFELRRSWQAMYGSRVTHQTPELKVT